MKIDRQEARRIAALAHLEFDDAALDRMANDMSAILTYIDQLKEVDVAQWAGASAVGATPLREDEVRESIPRDAVEKNAPKWRDGHFVVPKVIGE
jgi:aspartyl-tRNA(Asn)/glutamyl-tRNA(Gln) amidotransferase subunit C